MTIVQMCRRQSISFLSPSASGPKIEPRVLLVNRWRVGATNKTHARNELRHVFVARRVRREWRLVQEEAVFPVHHKLLDFFPVQRRKLDAAGIDKVAEPGPLAAVRPEAVRVSVEADEARPKWA